MAHFTKTGKVFTSKNATISGNHKLRIPDTLEICPLPMTDDGDENEEEMEQQTQDPIDLSYVNVSTQKRQRYANSSFFDEPEPAAEKMPRVWHICELCDNNFPSRKVLTEHMWKVHKTQRIPFQTEVTVSPEVVEVVSPSTYRQSRRMTFPCAETTSSRSLTDEIIYHPPTSNRRRTSNSSSSGSGSSYTHSNHVDLETEGHIKVEICRVCLTQFGDKRELNDHMKMFHPTDNRFCCTICDRVLSSRAALQGHLRIHTQEKPYNCEICNRAFSNSQTLSRHMRTHTGERPYECGICGKRASLRHNMKLHIKIHEKQMQLGEEN